MNKEDLIYKEFLNICDEETKEIIVQTNMFDIQFIDDPSEKIQMIAYNQYPLIIEYIQNPCKILQEALINKNVLYLRYIKNPSVDIQKLALSKLKEKNDNDQLSYYCAKCLDSFTDTYVFFDFYNFILKTELQTLKTIVENHKYYKDSANLVLAIINEEKKQEN